LEQDINNKDFIQLDMEEINKKIEERQMIYLLTTNRVNEEFFFRNKEKDDFHYRFVDLVGHALSEKTESLQLLYFTVWNHMEIRNYTIQLLSKKSLF
jgi:hypothetical protein